MLKAAVIGLGWWGKTVVEMLEGSKSLSVAAAMTRSPGGIAYAKAHGLRVFGDYGAVVRDPALDAVILCTPHTTHFEQIVAAADAKKHVFCEKPLTLTRREAVDAVAACNAHKVVLGVGHERRFDLAIQALRGLVAAGELGTLLQVETNFSQDKFLELPADNWRLSAEEAPAGPMTATGVHMLDLAVSFLGAAERVMVNVATLGSGLKNGDTLGALVRFRSGACALISAILATPYDGRFALFGTKGWAEVRDKTHPDAPTGSTLTVCRKGDLREEKDFPAVPAVRRNLEAFAEAALGGAPYPMPQAEMIATVAALEAIVKSAASGDVEPVEG
ncbi:MAG TPA: Gfo/Idh/MocA family oxidoreductase [Alphaproteobacteria bacterium]|nr:Gfo/Idh/MocA family oxidoreductase [Alphaproteobacteria bacterium]